MTENEDLAGSIAALTTAISALAGILTQDQRNQFHQKMRMMNPATQSPGYMKTTGDIIRATR